MAQRLASEEYTSTDGGERFLALSGDHPALEALQLDVALRLFGFGGVLFLLDAALTREPREAVAAKIRLVAALCRKRQTPLTLVSARPAGTMQRLLAAMGLARRPGRRLAVRPAQPRLGRRRSTTSTPTISIPSGGAG